MTFVLKDLRIEDATALTTDALQPLFAADLNQEISLTRVYDIAAAITARYRAEGYILSRAAVPAQRIRDGVVRIQVVEGYIDQIHIEGDSYDNRDLVAGYAARLNASRPLHIDVLERYLLLINDLPGLSARSLLRPSQTMTGAADLVLSLDHAPLAAAASVDNRGSEFLGPEELTLNLQGNSILGLGEQTRISMVGAGDVDGGSSNELRYYDVYHEEVLGDDGLTAGLRLSHSRTHPGGSLAGQDVDGRASSATLTLAYPWLRSRQENLDLRLAFAARNSRTTLLNQLLSRDRLRVLRMGASYDVVDSWDGISLVGLEISQGLDVLGASEAGDANLSRADGRSVFTKLNLDASRLQRISEHLNLLVAVTGQLSSAELLASEEFSAGGSQFGRGYDASEISGDHGFAGKLELQWNRPVAIDILNNYQFYGFYDFGLAWQEDSATRDSLASTGIGVRLNLTRWIAGNLELAYPLTRPVAARAPGKRDDPRLLFSLSARY